MLDMLRAAEQAGEGELQSAAALSPERCTATLKLSKAML